MATIEKEKEEKYYTLKDVHNFQIDRLRKLGVREEELEKTREKILNHARDILNNISMQFASLAKKIDIAESLNSEDFGRIYKKLNSEIPIEGIRDLTTIKFLTLQPDDELTMVKNKE